MHRPAIYSLMSVPAFSSLNTTHILMAVCDYIAVLFKDVEPDDAVEKTDMTHSHCFYFSKS